jgi:hypothetical protein
MGKNANGNNPEEIGEYIADFEEKGTGGWKEKLEIFLGSRYFIAVCFVLIAIIAFSLGRISGLEEKREPVRVVTSSPNPSPRLGEGSSAPYQMVQGSATSDSGEVKGASIGDSGQVIASKSGTKYHYPWCAGAKQISEKNKIYFDSIESARAAGYTPASNCKGLK